MDRIKHTLNFYTAHWFRYPFSAPLNTKTGVLPGKVKHFYEKDSVILGIWLIVTLIFSIQGLIAFRYNNYLIFENTFRNLIQQQSFYAWYPQYHEDANHYGPIFSVLIAPFALLPNAIGLFVWNIFNCLVLFKAIKTLPFSDNERRIAAYIAIPCIVASVLSKQFNPTAAAFIILSYTLLNKDKGFWSAMFIILGTFIKLYGIVGLAFFFFVKDKPRFILYLLFWSFVFLILPMLFSSPEFILRSYQEWYASLVHKNLTNIEGGTSEVSIMGFFRLLFADRNISNLTFLSAGVVLFMLPYLNIKAYGKQGFQLLILASTLLFPVLFSTGSEDCTYVIAITGVGIWFLMEKSNTLKRWLLPLVIIYTCELPLVIFPELSKQIPIALPTLSVPFFIIWLVIIYNATTNRWVKKLA